MQTDIDVAVQGVGVRTNLMRGVQERLCLGLGQTCDVCMEINVKPKATAFELRKADFDCCRTGCWGQFHTLRDQQHGIVKTRTIPQRKKLLGVYALIFTAGRHCADCKTAVIEFADARTSTSRRGAGFV